MLADHSVLQVDFQVRVVEEAVHRLYNKDSREDQVLMEVVLTLHIESVQVTVLYFFQMMGLTNTIETHYPVSTYSLTKTHLQLK